MPQIYGAGNIEAPDGAGRPPYGFNTGYDLHPPLHLQLSQPQDQTKEDPTVKPVQLG